MSERLAWLIIKAITKSDGKYQPRESFSVQSQVNRNNPEKPYRTWRVDLGTAFMKGHVFAEADSFSSAVLKCLIKIGKNNNAQR